MQRILSFFKLVFEIFAFNLQTRRYTQKIAWKIEIQIEGRKFL